MSIELTDQENKLVENLKIDRQDFIRGESGFSKGENVLLTRARYINMMRLIMKLTGNLK